MSNTLRVPVRSRPPPEAVFRPPGARQGAGRRLSPAGVAGPGRPALPGGEGRALPAPAGADVRPQKLLVSATAGRWRTSAWARSRAPGVPATRASTGTSPRTAHGHGPQSTTCVEMATRDLAAVPNTVVSLRYESLVSRSEGTLRRVTEQLSATVDPGRLASASTMVASGPRDAQTDPDAAEQDLVRRRAGPQEVWAMTLPDSRRRSRRRRAQPAVTALVLGVVCTLVGCGKDPDASGASRRRRRRRHPRSVAELPAGRTDLDLRTPLASLENTPATTTVSGFGCSVARTAPRPGDPGRRPRARSQTGSTFGRTGAPTWSSSRTGAPPRGLRVLPLRRGRPGPRQRHRRPAGSARRRVEIQFAVGPGPGEALLHGQNPSGQHQDPDRDDQGRRLREATRHQQEETEYTTAVRRQPGRDLQRDGPLPGAGSAPSRTHTSPGCGRPSSRPIPSPLGHRRQHPVHRRLRSSP